MHVMIRDISQGSRLEVSGIRTVKEAVRALWILKSLGARSTDQFHVYLSGTSFNIWVGVKEE